MDIQPRIRNRNALGRHVLRHRVHDCHDIGRAKRRCLHDGAFFRTRTPLDPHRVDDTEGR